MTGKPIGTLLKNSKELQPFYSAVARHTEILRVIRRTIPRSLADVTSVSHTTGGTLTLLVNNGASAAKVKQLSPSLVEALSQQGHEINRLNVRVQARVESNTLLKKNNLMSPIIAFLSLFPVPLANA